VELPPPDRIEQLLEAVLPEQDPALVEPFVTALRGAQPSSPRMVARPGMPPFDMDGLGDLKGIGQWHERGKMPEPPVFTTGALAEYFDKVMKALTSQPPRPVLVVGESGVGKTALARSVAAHLSRDGWRVFEAGASQLNAGMSFVGMLERRLLELPQAARRRAQVAVARARLPPAAVERPRAPVAHRCARAADARVRVGRDPRAGRDAPGHARPAARRAAGDRPAVRDRALAPWRDADVDDAARGVGRAHRARAPRQRRAVAAGRGRAALAPVPVEHARARRCAAHARAGGHDVAPAAATVPAGGAQHEDLLRAVSSLSGLPEELLDEQRPLDLEALRTQLEQRVIGQPMRSARWSSAWRCSRPGVTDPSRPYGVFLFAGPTGTGKTELAKRSRRGCSVPRTACCAWT
jgi:ATP-dependent Clp protease ATP-binding subunit ClpC